MPDAPCMRSRLSAATPASRRWSATPTKRAWPETRLRRRRRGRLYAGLMQMTAYMLDSNVFNRLTDEQVSFDAFRGLRLVATHIQWDELRAAKDKHPARAAELLRTFEKVAPRMDRTASAFFDVSNWDQANWSPENGVDRQMLERLTQLNAAAGKKHPDPKNPIRDVLIALTAININAMLISDDEQLRQLVSEFGGRAISTSDLPAR